MVMYCVLACSDWLMHSDVMVVRDVLHKYLHTLFTNIILHDETYTIAK